MSFRYPWHNHERKEWDSRYMSNHDLYMLNMDNRMNMNRRMNMDMLNRPSRWNDWNNHNMNFSRPSHRDMMPRSRRGLPKNRDSWLNMNPEFQRFSEQFSASQTPSNWNKRGRGLVRSSSVPRLDLLGDNSKKFYPRSLSPDLQINSRGQGSGKKHVSIAKKALKPLMRSEYIDNDDDLSSGIYSPPKLVEKAGPSNLLNSSKMIDKVKVPSKKSKPAANLDDPSCLSPHRQGFDDNYIQTDIVKVCRVCNVLCYPASKVEIHVESDYHKNQVKSSQLVPEERSDISDQFDWINNTPESEKESSNASRAVDNLKINPLDTEKKGQDCVKRIKRKLSEEEMDFSEFSE